jgi:hypothetical protein
MRRSSNCLGQVLVGLAFAVGPLAFVVCASQGQTATEAPTISGQRVLHFPTDRFLGRLLSRPVQPEKPVDGFYYWLRDDDWRVLGPARGEVVVPAGHEAWLMIESPQGWRDLSPLAQLAADDLYALRIEGPYTAGARPGDSCMPHVAHLTGLRVLSLTNTNITGPGMRQMVALKTLRYLSVPDGLDDAGMAYVGQLSSLIGLYFKQNRVTNAGLKHLAKLHLLAELELGGGQINNDGLACLADLPQLRYLILWGKGFTDAGLGRLKDVKALEILDLGVLENITDAGLAQLANVPQLRDIGLYHNTKISNAGLVPLKKLPNLRTLDITHSKVTDEGLTYLKEIKTLEGLMLPGKGITDRGLAIPLRVAALARAPDAAGALRRSQHGQGLLHGRGAQGAVCMHRDAGPQPGQRGHHGGRGQASGQIDPSEEAEPLRVQPNHG